MGRTWECKRSQCNAAKVITWWKLERWLCEHLVARVDDRWHCFMRCLRRQVLRWATSLDLDLMSHPRCTWHCVPCVAHINARTMTLSDLVPGRMIEFRRIEYVLLDYLFLVRFVCSCLSIHSLGIREDYLWMILGYFPIDQQFSKFPKISFFSFEKKNCLVIKFGTWSFQGSKARNGFSGLRI